MNMAQRTSSAAELTMSRSGPGDFPQPTAASFEFSPAQEKITGLFYLDNAKPTVQGPWVIFDGFYLSSHGDKVTIAVLVYKDLVDGTFSENKGIPSQITKSGDVVYFLNRDMAEFYAKNILEPQGKLLKSVCGKTYNNLVDQLEDRDQAGHFEDGLVLVTECITPKDESHFPVIRGVTEVIANKKLYLVHVVASLKSPVLITDNVAQVRDRKDLIEPMYYVSERVAGFGFNDRVKGLKILSSMRGGSYEDVIQHLARNSK